jgi:P-type E1-E2 ATPase
LESLAAVRAVRWDKTGTLTTGAPRVERIVCEHSVQHEEVERLAAAMVGASQHVFSRAIREFLADVVEPAMDDVQTVAGRGLRGIAANGDEIVLGSPRWMNEHRLNWGSRLLAVLADERYKGRPLTAIGYRGEVRGLFLLEETVRPEAVEAIHRIRDLGLDQSVLTGDRASRASILERELGLPVLAELLPEDKLAAIRAAHDEFGSVAMVGDGLNDAPALAAADVGIALGCGADVSRDCADVCLLPNDLRLAPWSCALARKAVATIRTNLAWSFGYNSLGVIVAACGQLHPALAAALMVASSVMVLGNSLRLSDDGPFGLRRPLEDAAGLSELVDQQGVGSKEVAA